MTTALIKKESTLGSTLLVSGCCIGAGMLGLPAVSAPAGFFPSTLAMLLAYFFATGTGLLLLESTLWFDRKVNLLSIAQFALGKGGKYLAGCLYLFLFYTLFVAYIDAGGGLIASFLHLPREAGMFACVALVAACVYAGTKAVVKINRALILGLAASYFALIAFGLPLVEAENLQKVDFPASFSVIPVLLICFGYQNLVPSLTHYLKGNARAVRKAIYLGTLIPFAIYFLWIFVILGMLPSGDFLSVEKSPKVQFIVQTFSLFALLTSFIPNALTFADLLKDGSSRLRSDLVTYGLVLIPPMVCSLLNPGIFLSALGFAGGCIDVLLFGALPAAAVFIGRYIKKAEGPYRVGGGKLTLAAIFLFSIGMLLMKTMGNL